MNRVSPWFFRFALIVILAICGVLASNVLWKQAFSTDVFDLLSHDNRLPQATQKVQTILQKQLSREILLAVTFGKDLPDTDQKAAFLQTVRSLPSFQSVSSTTDMPVSDETSNFFFQHRIELLFPKWLVEHKRKLSNVDWNDETVAKLADITVKELDAFFSTPESMAFEPLLSQDPLLLIPGLQRRFDSSSIQVSQQPVWIFTAQLKHPPSSHEVQQQLDSDLNLLRNWVNTHLGNDTQLKDTGFHRFAEESEAKIRSEIFRLNFLSLGLTLIITLIFLRKPWLLLPVILTVVSSIACALIVTVSLLGQIHIIALVIGSILAGVAIDYCFHILMKREELKVDTFAETLKIIRIPLLASCASTIFGFLVLLANPVSAIQQVGVFVSFGLAFALLFSSLTALSFDFNGKVNWSRHLNYQLSGLHHRIIYPFRWIITLLALACFFLFHENRDNIEDLQIRLTEAPKNDSSIRSLLGETSGSVYWITVGDSLQEVIDDQSLLASHVSSIAPEASFLQVASLLPSSTEIRQFLDFRDQWGTTWISGLRESLERHGFDSEGFSDFWQAWDRAMNSKNTIADWEALDAALTSRLEYPLSLLIHGNAQEGYWGTTRIRNLENKSLMPPEHSFELAPLKVLNQAFSGYRHGVSESLWISAMIILAALLAVFKIRKTYQIIQIPLMAVIVTLGCFAVFGEAITFFHLIGILLGTCITLDYAVFSIQHDSGSNEPISIRASALTTIASFAALSMSRIPAVSDLGITVLLIAFLGLLNTECALQMKTRDE